MWLKLILLVIFLILLSLSIFYYMTLKQTDHSEKEMATKSSDILL